MALSSSVNVAVPGPPTSATAPELVARASLSSKRISESAGSTPVSPSSGVDETT